jgi:hypothetical protein
MSRVQEGSKRVTVEGKNDSYRFILLDGFKMSGFKMSGFKTSERSGLQNVRFSKHQVCKTSGRQNVRSSKRQVFKKTHPYIVYAVLVVGGNPQVLLQPCLQAVFYSLF